MKNTYSFLIGLSRAISRTVAFGGDFYTVVIFLMMTGVASSTYAQCGDGTSGTACGNTTSGDAIIDVSTVNSVTINQWQTLSTTSTGQPRWQFTGMLAGTVIQFADCTGQDSELTISNPSGTVIQRDADNDLSVGLGCTPNANDESFSYYATVNGSHVVRMSKHGNCANMNAGTKYLYWRVLNRPCSSITPTYGANSWNSYVYDNIDLNYIYNYIGNQTAWDNLNYNWGTSQPTTTGSCGVMCDADNYSTRHMMNRTFTRSVYKVTYSSDDGIRISFDGGNTWTLNLWNSTTNSGSFTVLLDGNTNVVVDQREITGGASVNVTFCQMDGSYTFGINQWNAYVHDNMDVSIDQYQGTFVQSSLNFCNSWGAGQPTMAGQRCGQTMDNDYFSVRYVRQETFSAGTYSVRCVTDDGHRVGINTGTSPSWNVFNSWNTSTNDQTTDISLSAGLHYIYYDMRENTGGAQASFNIVRIPDNPTGITSSVAGNLSCSPGGNVTLTAQGTQGTVYWYTGSCGGTFIGTGNSIVVNPTSSTTYFARNRNYNDAGCGNTLERFSPGCASITIAVSSPPTAVNAGSDVTICDGGSTNLSGSATPPILTSTNSYSGGAVTINASGNASPYPSTLSVSGVTGNITDIKVYINNLSHTWPTDIDMVLFGPTGAHSIIFTDAIGGSGGISGRNYTFQIGASALPLSGFPASGIYGVVSGGTFDGIGTPGAVNSANLNNFVGTSPNGTWSLYVYDDATGDAGSIGSWSLDITSSGPAPLTYSWSPGTGLSNSNIANPVASPSSTTTYTMTVSANGCTASDAVVVTVRDPFSGGTLSSASQTICNNTQPSNITYSTAPTGGSTTTFQWYRQAGSVACPSGVFNGTGWTAVGASSTSTPTLTGATIGNLTGTTTFALRVYDSGTPNCFDNWAGNCHVVTVDPSTVGGSTSGGSTPICLGSSTGTITLSSHTGSVLRWEKQLNGGGWTTISNTTTSFSETPSSAGTWEYRAVVKSGVCAEAGSSIRTIVVDPSTVGGSTSGGTTPICFGNGTGTITLSGHTGSIVRWEKQVNGGGWTTIANTTTTYSETPSSAGTWEYRAVVKSGVCAEANSSVTAITVDPSTVAGSVSGGSSPICAGSATGTLTLSGHTGSVVKWQKRVNAGSWTDIANTTTTYSETPSSSGAWEYRAEVKSGACNAAFSSAVSIQVNDVPAITSVTAGANPLSCGSTTTLTANGVPSVGVTVTWWTGTGGTGTNLGTGTTLSNADGGVYYARVTSATCSPPAEASITVSSSASNDVVLVGSTVSNTIDTCDSAEWTYYENPGTGDYIFAIAWNGNSGRNTATVSINTGSIISDEKVRGASVSKDGSFVMGRYWNVNGAGTLANPVKIRFYYDPADLVAVEAARNTAVAAWNATNPPKRAFATPSSWFKTVGVAFSGGLINDGNNFAFDYILLSPSSTGTENGVDYVQFDGITSFSGGGFGAGYSPGSGAPLPVTYLSFKAKAVENSYIRLDWATASERDNKGFVVERSEDGKAWTTIGWADGNGTTTAAMNYTYNDNQVAPNVVYYYRLRQTDYSGREELSNIVSAKIVGEDRFEISDFIPTRVEGATLVNVLSTTDRSIHVKVVNMLGQEVYANVKTIAAGNSSIAFDFSHLAAGTYSASFTSNGEIVGKKFVVVR